MPRPKELENYDLMTADFAYIRWLGDRKGIEKLTTTWNQTINRSHDRSANMGGCLRKDPKARNCAVRLRKQSLLGVRAGDSRTVPVTV